MKKEKFIDFNKKLGNEYDLKFIPENKEFTNSDEFKVIHKPCGNEMFKSYRSFSRKRNLENKTRGCKYCSGKVVTDWNNRLSEILGEDYEILNEIKSKSTEVIYKHELCGKTRKSTVRNILNGSKCNFCSKTRLKTYEEVKESVEEDTGNSYKLLDDKYINSDEFLNIKHNECGNAFKMRYYCFVNGQRCPICKKSSKGENLIREYLIKNNIEFEEQVKFEGLKYKKSLSFDFKIFLESGRYFLLEFDGKQHFKITGWTTEEILRETKKRDNIKNDFCHKNDIHLLRINYKEIKNIKNILDNYISSTTIM